MRRMFLVMLALVAGVSVVTGLSRDAFAQKRVALVIGNNAYGGIAALQNPVRDAEALAAMLSTSGFEVTPCQRP